jgi:hypothetical protein
MESSAGQTLPARTPKTRRSAGKVVVEYDGLGTFLPEGFVGQWCTITPNTSLHIAS